jgi:hypothetical protein
MSEINTPSTSVTATGNETVTLADEVKKYDTESLINFLRGQELGLDDEDLEIIRKEKVTSRLSQNDQTRFPRY